MVGRKSSFNECSSCGKDKFNDEFLRYNSSITKDRQLSVCKGCLKKRYDDLLDLYRDIYLALMHLCLNFDIPFDLELAEEIMKNKVPSKSAIEYLEAITNKIGLKKSTSCSDDTTDNVKNLIKKLSGTGEHEDEFLIDFEVTRDMYARWGFEYTKQEMFFLQTIYDSLVDEYGEGTIVESRLFTDYAIGELMKKRAKEKGSNDEYMKLRASQSKLIADAALKPKRENMANNDNYLIGMIAKTIEETRPVAEIDDKYKDIDGIQKQMDSYIEQLKRSVGAFR